MPQNNIGYNEIMKKLIILITIAVVLFLLWITTAFARQETCPDGGLWVKIDSGDLSLYPVSNAVEYCFKAGNFLDDEIPEGGFGQDGSCKNGIAYCELSHWSYKIGEITPTPTIEPTPEPTKSPTPSVSPTPTTITPTPTDEVSPTPTITPTTTPTPINENGCCKTENDNPVDETGKEVVLEPAPMSK